ncbi:hypothetical protein D3C72_2199270 [compost metagenome]
MRKPDQTIAATINAAPAIMRGVGSWLNSNHANAMAYTGSRAITKPALRAFSRVRLDTNR